MNKSHSIQMLSRISSIKSSKCLGNSSLFLVSLRNLTAEVGEVNDDSAYADIPKPPKSKTDRKPYPTPMKILIKRAKQEKEARKAQPCKLLEHPPENGLLVPELVHVAHTVYQARGSLLFGLPKLLDSILVHRCRYCNEVHIGRIGHEIRTCTGPSSDSRSATHEWRTGGIQDLIYFPKSFHLYDRAVNPRIVHKEWKTVRRIPAIVELCIQAGLNLKKFPTKRRTKPVYSIEGRIVDYDPETEECNVDNYYCDADNEKLRSDFEDKSLSSVSTMTMDSWFKMIQGTKKIMEKYKVWTCGYCPEVQVGPKGHKVRMCKASKHQQRNGMHAWQEATIDDIVGPNYVWHAKDSNGPVLANDLKRYYGKAPAVVELCVQGGAPVPEQYRSMMRLDVIRPDRDEVDLVT